MPAKKPKSQPKPKVESQTKQQWGLPVFGGSYTGYPYVMQNEQGVKLLPTGAAMLGSGALEGKNPYSYSQWGTWGGTGVGVGGGIGNGYGFALPGTISTYRLMLRHPTIALAAMVKTAPIVAGRWGYGKTCDDAPEGAVELIQSVFDPVRTNISMELLRGLWYGFADLESIWGTNRDGAVVPLKFKSLLQDITTIEVDQYGEIAWINNTGVELQRPNFIHFEWNREGSNWYGESRLENCRRTWANWLADEDQLYRLENKAAGILVDIGFPPDYVAPGTTIRPGESNYDRAIAMAQYLTSGRSVVHENLTGIAADEMLRVPELADKSLFKITKHDMGNTGPSQMALIESLRYKDALLARGILVPERSMIEATAAGSRADSESHNSVNDGDADTIHALLCEAINEQCVDAILLQNYGPRAVGTVRIKPKEIIDENRIVDEKLLDAALKDPALLHSVFESMDVDDWAKRNGIQLKEGETIEVPDDAGEDDEKMDKQSGEELSATLSRAWGERKIA